MNSEQPTQLERYARLLDEARAIQGVSLGKDAWRRLRRSWSAMASLVFLVLLALSAACVPLLPLQSPSQQSLATRKFLPPTSESFRLPLAGLEGEARENALSDLFGNRTWLDQKLIQMRLAIFGDWSLGSLFGTDELGRDVLARTLWGARVSLMVGVVATFVSLVIGISYGAIAGYLGGRTDNLMMRLVDVLYSIPFIFVVIYLITVLDDPKIKATLATVGVDKITIFYFLIGAIYWLTMARVVRGQVISLKNEQFIEAARTIGASQRAIVFRHLIPNLLSIAIVYLTLTIPAVMLFEAFLSFLGLGVDPPDVSWGILAADGIKVITPVKTYWWLVVFPGLALALTLFALNFLGDGLRDALDPRMKNR